MTHTPFIPVSAVMSPDPETIDGLVTVEDALTRMRVRNISSVVVQRRDRHDEFGLLLIADIARAIATQDRSISRTSVYELMVKPAPAVDAEMDIRYAIRHMARLALSHSIVLQQRELVGIVTLRDMTLRLVEASSAP